MRARIGFDLAANGIGDYFTLDDATKGVMPGEGYVTLPGTTGHDLLIAHAASLSLADDIEIVVDVLATDWTPASASAILSKRLGNNVNYQLLLVSTGELRFNVCTAAAPTTVINYTSTVPTGLTNGTRKCIKVTRARVAGQVKIFLADSVDGPWTQLGATIAATTAALNTNTQPVYVGSRDGLNDPFGGRIYRAIVRNGIDGTSVLDADVSVMTDSALRTFTARTGQPVTINGASSFVTLSDAGFPLAGDVLVDVTNRLRRVDVRRGRSWTLDRFTAGNVNLVLDNRAREFDPLFVFTGSAVNLCVNPSFETGLDFWSAGSGTTMGRTTVSSLYGTYSMTLERTSTTGHASATTTITPTPGTAGNYLVMFYARSDSYAGQVDVTAVTRDYAGATSAVSLTPAPVGVTSTWTQAYIDLGTIDPTTVASIDITITTTTTTMTVGQVLYIDAVLVGDGLGTTIPDYFDGSAWAPIQDPGGYRVIRQGWTGTPHASTSTITVSDNGSPYIGSLVPGKEVVVDIDGQVIATAITSDWNYDYTLDGDAVALVSCTDAFDTLARVTTVAGTATAQATGTRIGAVLDAASWPDEKRDLSTGQVSLGADVLTDTVPVLTYLQKVELSEPGALFIDRLGRVAFRDRSDLQQYVNPVRFGTSGVPFSAISVDYGKERLTNKVNIVHAAGTAVVEDSASQTAYGVIEATYDTLLANSTDATALGTWIISRYAQPVYRIEGIEVNLAALTSEQRGRVLDLDLGDVVEVSWQPSTEPGLTEPITQVLTIDGIEHSADPQQHRIRFDLSTTVASFLLDDDLYGLLDVSPLGF